MSLHCGLADAVTDTMFLYNVDNSLCSSSVTVSKLLGLPFLSFLLNAAALLVKSEQTAGIHGLSQQKISTQLRSAVVFSLEFCP